MKEKAVVLYSGGLDSRLVAKILEEQGLEIELLFFQLPFSCSCNNLKGFEDNLKIIDCTKGILFKEYMSFLKNPKHKTGKGVNPCIDCKIFMFRKAKEYAEKHKIKIIASGEVLNERPMSQKINSLKIIEKESGCEILRPLSAKLLDETSYEKNNLVDRRKFYSIRGKQRNIQIKLAERYDIKFPTPSGGCFLCEKAVKKRMKMLLEKNFLDEENFILARIGKHFVINGSWFVVSRNEKESIIIEKFRTSLESDIKTPTVFYNNENMKETAEKIREAFFKKESAKFSDYKI